ncbi:MAG: RNA polymerase sigma factor, partial [Actinomycetota bacterium]
MVLTQTTQTTQADRATGGRLEELYRAHAPDALRLAYLLTGDRGVAEDLAQDAFVKVFGRFHDLRNRGSATCSFNYHADLVLTLLPLPDPATRGGSV